MTHRPSDIVAPVNEVSREDLRVIERIEYEDYPEHVLRVVYDDEFDQIARAEGYVKLEGIDVEALRETAARWERYREGKRPAPIRPIIDLIERVLAALDGEGEA